MSDLKLGEDLDRYEEAEKDLQYLGLGTHLNKMSFPQQFHTNEFQRELVKLAYSRGLEYQIDQDEGNSSGIVTTKQPFQVWFWRGKPKIRPEDVADAYNKDDHQRVGEFLGYPKCCVEALENYVSVERYFSELRKRLDSRGVSGIEHLVGIQHIPHSIDCKPTRGLRYSDFLKQNAPLIYAFELCDLVEKVLNFPSLRESFG